MKTKIAFTYFLFIFLSTACSKVNFSTQKSANTTTTVTSTPTPTPIPTATPTPTESCSGNTADLQIESTTVFNNYVLRTLNNLNTPRIRINLFNSNSRTSGEVLISYYEGGSFFETSFSAPSGYNESISSLNDNGILTSEYNYWSNETSFSGFFQDPYGAIVVVLNRSSSSSNCASGKIYFKNFNVNPLTNIQSPYRKCWFIRSGPYNCRADEIINKTSQVPSNYTYLGSFSGININQSIQ